MLELRFCGSRIDRKWKELTISLGARLDTLSVCDSPKYTPPHTRLGIGSSRFALAMRTAGNGWVRSMVFLRLYQLTPSRSPTCRVSADDCDDVFVSSPAKPLRERRSERSITAGNMQRLDVALANGEHTLRARSSNVSGRHQIDGVDAQNLYPPTACVFVAK